MSYHLITILLAGDLKGKQEILLVFLLPPAEGGSPPRREFSRHRTGVSNPGRDADQIEVPEDREKVAPTHGKDFTKLGRAQFGLAPEALYHGLPRPFENFGENEEIPVEADELVSRLEVPEDIQYFVRVPLGLCQLPDARGGETSLFEPSEEIVPDPFLFFGEGGLEPR